MFEFSVFSITLCVNYIGILKQIYIFFKWGNKKGKKVVAAVDQDLDVQEYKRLYLTKVATTVSPSLHLFFFF